MNQDNPKTIKRVREMIVADVYPFYVAKAEKKGKTKAEVDEIFCWLTGYTQIQLEQQFKSRVNFEDFFSQAPKLNPSRSLIKGVICGVRVEEIKDPTLKLVRYLDKLVDDLARGRDMSIIEA
jgi:hypothetical protein